MPLFWVGRKQASASVAATTWPAAVCIVSGGLDSVCYAAMLAREGFDIHMITFAYGQRAAREIRAARRFARLLGAGDHKIVDIGFMRSLYGRSNALTDRSQKLSREFEQSLVVPIRNAIFITIASAWAMSIDARVVAYGAHAGDVPHYADCRPAFASALASALNMADADSIASGKRHEIEVTSPAARGMDKSALLSKGYAILGDRLFETWSCYSDGVRAGKSGYVHCGVCESCINRKMAFKAANIGDRTRYAA